MAPEKIRLNKFIASHLNLGRRAADDLIAAQKVRVNDELPILGMRVKPGDTVQVNGKTITVGQSQFLYVLMNKPIGYVCSRRQQGDTPTIYSLLPAKYQHLKSVGRLDKDSCGVILLTNDGNLAHQLTHPSFIKEKQYEVTLDKSLQPADGTTITTSGVTLPDGISKFQLKPLAGPKNWRVIMHQGRNRQIRRTFAALGYTVTYLRRTQFGPYTLGQLGDRQLLEITPA